MAGRVLATATVRAMKGRKPLPTRAALVIVSYHHYVIYANSSLEEFILDKQCFAKNQGHVT